MSASSGAVLQKVALNKLRQDDLLRTDKLRHISVNTENELQHMTLSFFQYPKKGDAPVGIMNYACWLFTWNTFGRGEDARQRRLSDVHVFDYPGMGSVAILGPVVLVVLGSCTNTNVTSIQR